ILQFFQDIFDALFAIWDSKAGSSEFLEPQVILVYNAIVYILGVLLSTSRFNFRILLDYYIEQLFQGTKTHLHFLGCLGFYLGHMEPEKNLSHITSSFKVRIQTDDAYCRITSILI